MSSSKKTVVIRESVPVVTVTPAKAGKTRRGRRTSLRSLPKSNSLVSQYIGTLNDPFDVAPPKLGYGTFDEVSFSTAYIHGTSPTNADGTISFIMTPAPSQMVAVNNSGVGGTTWTGNAALNYSAIGAEASVYRLVSGGFRVCPLVSATAVPGLVYASSLSGQTAAQVIATGPTSTQIAAYPAAHIGLATYGATILLRPNNERCIEPTNISNAIGPGASAQIEPAAWSIPVVTLVLPAGVTAVAWEAVLNLELLPSGSNNGSSISYNRSYNRGLSAQYPAYSQLFNLIAPSLRDPVSLDFNEGGPASSSSTNRGTGFNMYGSSNARRAKGNLSNSAFNMTFLTNDIKENQERANVRSDGFVSHDYVDVVNRVAENIVNSRPSFSLSDIRRIRDGA